MTRLFHISDLHFGAEDKAALAWFQRVVQAEAPDAIVVTGDLTMRARPEEFEAAGEWLKSLNRPISVEAGNHDLPAFDLLARFFTPYRRYNALERMIERPLDLPGVAIVPLKTTARFQLRLNWSKGNVSARSLRKTLAMAEAAREHGLVIVASHHPLLEPGTRTTSETRGGAHALNALAAAGVAAVLTGHVHDSFDVAHEANGRVIRLIGAGTLSERIRETPPSFNEIRIQNDGINTIARSLSAGDGMSSRG